MNHRRRLALLLLAVAGCRAAPAIVAEPWQPIPTPTTASLRGLAAVDARVAWVGGTNGTLLRTDDGGASWQDVCPAGAADCDFRDLHAFSAEVALAMVAGQPARVYRTEDGGASWVVVHEDPRPAAFLDAIAFAGDDGVLFGDAIDGAFEVWQSRDAGRTWHAVAPARLPPPQPDEAAFAASGTCVALGHGPRAPQALVVTGGGAVRCLGVSLGDEAPRAVPLPLAHGAASRGAFSLALRGARAVAVGGDYRDPQAPVGTAARSDDGGATWSAADAGGYRSAVVWLDDRRLLAVGSHGASDSVDGGRSWRPCGRTGFHSLAVGGDGSVWACGSEGRVARWRDSLRTW